MARWDPWWGCHRYSQGSKFCYIHKGESDRYVRPMYYDWVLSLWEQCIRQNVSFDFRQCGTHFIKDGKAYTLQ